MANHTWRILHPRHSAAGPFSAPLPGVHAQCASPGTAAVHARPPPGNAGKDIQPQRRRYAVTMLPGAIDSGVLDLDAQVVREQWGQRHELQRVDGRATQGGEPGRDAERGATQVDD